MFGNNLHILELSINTMSLGEDVGDDGGKYKELPPHHYKWVLSFKVRD